MGLHCSRQGYIQEFHELKGSRLAPEGQCFSVDLLKSSRANLTPEQIKRLSVLLQDEKLGKRLSASLCINNFENAERVLYGQECKSLLNEKLVSLPPEGKDGNEADYVELPNLKDNEIKSSQNLVVDLSSEYRSNEEIDICSQVKSNNNKFACDDKNKRKDSTCSSKFSSTRKHSNHSDDRLATKNDDVTDDEQWMYTLYDFQENGFVTKQDVSRLMDSICSVVNSTLSGDHTLTDDHQNTAPSDNNNFKVHLQIGRRKKSKSDHRHYRSDVDNHEHAKNHSPKQSLTDKCSRRYLPSRKYKGMVFPPPNTEEAEKVSSYIEEKVLNHRRRTSQHGQSYRKPRNVNTDSLQSSSKSTCRKCLMNSDVNNKLSKESQYVIPKRRDSDPCVREKCNNRVIVTTEPLIHHTNSKTRRYKKIGESCDVSNSDQSLSPSSMSGSNTPFSADEVFLHQRNNDKESENSRFRHSCSCRRKPRSKCYEENIYESNRWHKTTNSRQREMFRQIPSRKSSHDEKTTIENNYEMTRNEHRKMFRRHTNETAALSVRPDVWPGGAASVVSEKPTTESKNIHELCFCKRMLGLDYQCNHPL